MMSTGSDQSSVSAGSSVSDKLAQLQTQIAGRLKLGLQAKFSRYGLSRDLSLPFENPKAKIPISVRPLQDSDLASLFTLNDDAAFSEKLEIASRRSFIAKGARGGYVAVDDRNGTPCYVQWLIGAKDNDFIQRLGGFPVLKSDEALLENAYTPPAYRGMGIMPAAMALIAERGADLGARYILTFVDLQNIPSLKGCQRAGFYPRMLHHKTRLGFGMISRHQFETLPDDDPRRTAKF